MTTIHVVTEFDVDGAPVTCTPAFRSHDAALAAVRRWHEEAWKAAEMDEAFGPLPELQVLTTTGNCSWIGLADIDDSVWQTWTITRVELEDVRGEDWGDDPLGDWHGRNE